MSLILPREVLKAIGDHAERTYPEECAGLLLGKDVEGGRDIKKCLPLENSHPGPKTRRVEIHPREYLRGERLAAQWGLEVWGFYHSHPDEAAVPSPYDLKEACFQDWSYLIASVCAGKAVDFRSWSLRADRASFEEEKMTIQGDSDG